MGRALLFPLVFGLFILCLDQSVRADPAREQRAAARAAERYQAEIERKRDQAGRAARPHSAPRRLTPAEKHQQAHLYCYSQGRASADQYKICMAWMAAGAGGAARYGRGSSCRRGTGDEEND